MEEENTEETQGIIPPFLRKPQNPAMMDPHGVQKSLHVFRRSRRRRCREGSGGAGGLMMIKEAAVKEVKGKSGGGGDCTVEEKEEEEEEAEGEGEDDREEVERKIHALQRIVPGGESFGVDKLFDETAGYIMALQYQVKALKALTGFFDKLEKEKTKLGG